MCVCVCVLSQKSFEKIKEKKKKKRKNKKINERYRVNVFIVNQPNSIKKIFTLCVFIYVDGDTWILTCICIYVFVFYVHMRSTCGEKEANFIFQLYEWRKSFLFKPLRWLGTTRQTCNGTLLDRREKWRTRIRKGDFLEVTKPLAHINCDEPEFFIDTSTSFHEISRKRSQRLL